MHTHTILIDQAQVIPLIQALNAACQFLGGVKYQTTEKIQLTIETESSDLADVLECLAGSYSVDEIDIDDLYEIMADNAGEAGDKAQPEQEAQPSRLQSIVNAPDDPLLEQELAAHMRPVVIQDPVDAEKHAQRGLVACNEIERSVECPSCHNRFIRTSKNQDYCKRPECIKERARVYARKYYKKVSNSAETRDEE